MNILAKFTLSLTAILPIACSFETAEPQRIPFQDAPAAKKALTDSDYYWGDRVDEPDACAFLASKRADALVERGEKYKPFQMYRSFYSDDHGNLYGAHSIAKVPQILFMLSREGSEDSGPMYRSYDRWTFYLLAKKKLCSQIPDFCEYLNNRDAQHEKLNSVRNRLNTIGAKIANAENDAKQARAQKDYETLKSANTLISELRTQHDFLKGDIDRVKSMIETLNNQTRTASKHLKNTGTKEQIEILKYIESLIWINENWNATGLTSWNTFVDVKKKFTVGRNTYINKTLNKQVPGAHDDKDHPLVGSELLVRYLRYLEIAFPHDDHTAILRHVTTNIDTLRPLMTAEYSLFDEHETTTSWVNLERDVANALALLAAEPVGLQEATCKFAISQRLIAQIVSMKGIRQSPKLTAAGFLERLSEDHNHSVGHQDLPGIYHNVVDEAWIQKTMLVAAQDTPLPQGTINRENVAQPIEYFSAVKLFANIANTANAPFWTRNKNAPMPDELIPADLLKCAFGVMAIGLQAAQIHFFNVHQTDINLIPEDSPEGFVKLIHATVQSLQALEAQYRMHLEKPELAFLSDKQLSEIGDNGKTKVLLLQLLYASTKRAMEFGKADSTAATTKAELRDAVHRAGAYLKNEALYLY